MRKFLSRFAGVAMALCLTLANLTPAAAAGNVPTANSTVPTVATATTDAQKSAAVLMKNALDNNSYSSISDTADLSAFTKVSRDLFLSIRSGYDCSANIDAYTTALSTYLNVDGSLSAASAYNSIACHAYMLNILTLAGFNVTNYNGKNLVSGFSSMLETVTATSLSRTVNSYYWGMLYTTVDTYSNFITNSDAIKAAFISSLESLCNASNIIDPWGYPCTDDFGAILPGYSSLYTTNARYKTIVDSSLAYAKTNLIDSASGSIVTSGSVNVDSTALGLAVFSTFHDAVTSAQLYNALMTRTSTETPGLFLGYNPIYATQDALEGLVTYQYALVGKTNIFDTTMTVDFSSYLKPDETEKPTTVPPSEEATEGPTTSTEAPTNSTEKPTSSTEAPTTSTEKPTSSSEAPTTSTEKSTSSSEVPTTAAQAASSDSNKDESVQTGDTHTAAAYMMILIAVLGCIMAVKSKKAVK